MTLAENTQPAAEAMMTFFANIGGQFCVEAIEQNLAHLVENVGIVTGDASADANCTGQFGSIVRIMTGLAVSLVVQRYSDAITDPLKRDVWLKTLTATIASPDSTTLQ